VTRPRAASGVEGEDGIRRLPRGQPGYVEPSGSEPLGDGRVLVAKVDTEAQPELGGRFGIRSIPTIALFRNGREAARVAGARPAADLERFALTGQG